MKKGNTAAAKQSRNIFQRQLTIGLDLGDRSSWYCVMDEAGRAVQEQRLSMTPKSMREVFGGMPRSRIALETGTHSPWVSRLLAELLLAFPFNGGPFPPPALPGFTSTSSLSVTPNGPGLSLARCRLIASAITAGASRVAAGQPCLLVVAITPAGLMVLVRSYCPISGGPPDITAGWLLR